MNIQSKIATCLWFDGTAEEAATFYTSLIPGSAITSRLVTHPDSPPLLVEFNLAGVPFQGLNGGPDFSFTEAASIVVVTDSQEETDLLWQALIANGGSESRCGWLRDRFGLSWQVVPQRFIELLRSGDAEAVGRTTDAMMTMAKLDIAALEAAWRGETCHG